MNKAELLRQWRRRYFFHMFLCICILAVGYIVGAFLHSQIVWYPEDPGYLIFKWMQAHVVTITFVCVFLIAIADALKDYDVEHIVVDPVMVATSGSRLMQDDAVEVFCKQLLPLATLLTPNIPETEVLSGITVSDKESMDSAALRILQLGCSNLLVKGGHLEGKKIDRLYGEVEREYVGENVVTRNTHGTGCTLSSAITSFLAQGLPVDEAIGAAKEWLTKALRAGADVEIGKGHGPVNHFFDPIKMKICPSNN